MIAESPYYNTDIVPLSRNGYDVFLNDTIIYDDGVAQGAPVGWSLNGYTDTMVGSEGSISLSLNYNGGVDSPLFKINFIRNA